MARSAHSVGATTLNGCSVFSMRLRRTFKRLDTGYPAVVMMCGQTVIHSFTRRPFRFLPATDDRLLRARFGLATALSPVAADRHALQISLGTVAFAGRRLSASTRREGRACEIRAACTREA